MFTGIVEGMGEVAEVRAQPPGVRLRIRARQLAADARLGDSIAINGCCLTVVETDGDVLAFDAGAETLSRTNLGRLTAASRVNLERSLRVGDRLGGHFVTGHIDGVGTLDERRDANGWSDFFFRAPAPLMRQMAEKGSVAVDGVSLTVAGVERQRFWAALIPHTLQVTTLGRLAAGDPVNLETDVLAKYVESLIARDPDLLRGGPEHWI